MKIIKIFLLVSALMLSACAIPVQKIGPVPHPAVPASAVPPPAVPAPEPADLAPPSEDPLSFMNGFCQNLDKNNIWYCQGLDKFPGGVEAFRQKCEAAGYEYHYSLKGYFRDSMGNCLKPIPKVIKKCVDESECAPNTCLADDENCEEFCAGACSDFTLSSCSLDGQQMLFVLKQGKVQPPIIREACEY
jgi:hypothetical protein